MPEKTLDDKLAEIVSMGKAGLDLLGATSDVIRSLSTKDEDGNIMEILTGDPVADASILRALGVERAIKDKWNVDIDQVIKVLDLLLNAFTTVSAFYKE